MIKRNFCSSECFSGELRIEVSNYQDWDGFFAELGLKNKKYGHCERVKISEVWEATLKVSRRFYGSQRIVADCNHISIVITIVSGILLSLFIIV